jgi:hypothetical protein
MKQGDAVMLLLHHFTLEYAIRAFQVSQKGYKLNGTHQLLVAAGDVSMLGRCINRSFSSS